MKTTKLIRYLAVLISIAFTAELHAQLPNAWQVSDDSTASSLNYTYLLPADVQVAATNVGFDFSVNARFLTSFGGTKTMTMIYGLGSRRFLIWWNQDANGDLTAELEGGSTYTLTTNGTGTALYHTHEIVYDPVTRKASYLFDGVALTTNWAGSATAWPAGEITWGSASSSGQGQMNFHRVSFIVTNGDVAAYDAGTEPTNAPDPQSQGWSLSPSSPQTGTSTNAISPDRGPDVVTTLADSGYGSLRQAIAGAPSGATITFFTNGVITLSSGQLVIADNLTIVGPGPANLAISGNNASRVFVIAGGATDSISGLTIQNGHAPNGGAGYPGGDGLPGGGIYIYNSGALTLSNCVITANQSGGGGSGGDGASGTLQSPTGADGWPGGPGGDGGGIFNGGVLSLIACTIATNQTGGGGAGGKGGAGYVVLGNGGNGGDGGNGGSGGGVYTSSSGHLALTNCILDWNAGGSGGPGGSGGAAGTGGNIGVSGGTGLDGKGGGVGNVSPNSTLNNCALTNNYGWAGGGIYNSNTLTLNNSTLAANSAINDGGGIFNAGTLTVNNCTVSNCTVWGVGNFGGLGGGIFNSNTLTLNNCTLSGNFAEGGDGGGIYNYGSYLTMDGGAVTMADCTLSDNSAENGGGIWNHGSNTLNRCTVADNMVSGFYGGDGGGIYNDRFNALDNCTIANNSAQAYGGGIDNVDTVTLNNCTLSGNSASQGGGIYASTLSFTNTIVAGNHATTDPNFYSAFSFSGRDNLTNGIPLLARLGNYGGSTQTMPPLAGSPAIDTGDDSVTSFLATDQRGDPRLSGAHVDIGAVEAQFVAANPNNPPVLENPVWSSAGGTNTFQYAFTNVSGADFTALTSTNLALPLADWTVLGNIPEISAGQYRFTGMAPTNDPQRFYQVVSP